MDVKKLQQSLVPFGIKVGIETGSSSPDIWARFEGETSEHNKWFTQEIYRNEKHLVKTIKNTLCR